MKFFKYIALLLLVAVTMGSCDKKDVSYMAEPVDESSKAYIQVGYYEPITAGAANYMYFIDINGVEYGNDGATFLATFNTVPSGGTNRYYAVDAGNVNLKLHKRVSDGNGGYTYPVVYDQNVTVEAGKRYCLYVHDLNKAPIPIEMTAAPEFGKALDTDSLCRVQFINLLYEADGPSLARLWIPTRCAACSSSTCSMRLMVSPTPARYSMVYKTLTPRSMSPLASPSALASAPSGSLSRSARPFSTAQVHSAARFASSLWITMAT